MKLLLTGANGFIGSHLVKRLVESGHTLIVLKRRTSFLWRIEKYIPQIQCIDFEDEDCFSKAFDNKIDIVIHLAGVYVKNEKNSADIEQMNSFNIHAASTLLSYATTHNVLGFINTGTFFEFNLYASEPIHERSELKPYNYYAATKIAFDTILQYTSMSSALKGVTLKLFSPYGEMDNDKVIPLIIKSCISSTPLVLNQHQQKLSFTYVEDIIDAYMKAIEYIVNTDFRYQDFNIGSENSYSIQEVVEMVTAITQIKNQVVFKDGAHFQGPHIDIRCDNRKAQKLLGFEPQTALKEGLKKTYDYYKRIV